MQKLVLLATMLALVGCRASYNVSNLAGKSDVRLDPKKSVFINVPADGAYGPKTYPGSGQTVAQSAAAAFSKHASKVTIADKVINNDEVLGAARKSGAAYIVSPTITHWEHRATEWSGRPSVMTIRITILDAATGEQLAASSIEGRSRIISWTTTSPESLLRDPVTEYVNGLY